MATSLFGICGKKVSKLDLTAGMAVLAYTAEDKCLFGVVVVETQPRHFALNIIAQIGIDDAMIGKSLVIRTARNEKEMVSQYPSTIPVAAVAIVEDVLEVWWAPEPDAQIALQERVELVRKISGLGNGVSEGAGPLPEVKTYALNPIR